MGRPAPVAQHEDLGRASIRRVDDAEAFARASRRAGAWTIARSGDEAAEDIEADAPKIDGLDEGALAADVLYVDAPERHPCVATRRAPLGAASTGAGQA